MEKLPLATNQGRLETQLLRQESFEAAEGLESNERRPKRRFTCGQAVLMVPSQSAPRSQTALCSLRGSSVRARLPGERSHPTCPTWKWSSESMRNRNYRGAFRLTLDVHNGPAREAEYTRRPRKKWLCISKTRVIINQYSKIRVFSSM